LKGPGLYLPPIVTAIIRRQSFPLIHLTAPHPCLQYFSIIVQNNEISVSPNLKLPSFPLAHHIRHVLRHAPHRFRQRTATPPLQITNTFVQPDTAPNQRVRAVNHDHIAPLPLRMWDLRVPGIHAVRQARQLDRVRDEDTSPGIRAVGGRQRGRVQVDAVGDDAVIGGPRRRDAAGEAGVAVVEGVHGVEDVGEGRRAGVQGGEAGVVVGGAVAEGDDGAVFFAQTGHELERAGELGGEGDEFDGGFEVGFAVGFFGRGLVGNQEEVCVVGTASARCEEGPFYVGAK